jgi:Xaa-Pro aminopeptidase
VESINPTTLLKSRKSAEEASHVREAMVQDGAAMCEFYAWLEAALGDGRRVEPITEVTIDERLSAARARRPGYVGPSFATIAAFNANGAMPHYRASPASHAVIEGNGLLLIDSGGQYRGGTTDITRVWPIGAIDTAQRRDYTVVLKGMVALSRTRYRAGRCRRCSMRSRGPRFGSTASTTATAPAMEWATSSMSMRGPQSISRTIAEPTMAMEPGDDHQHRARRLSAGALGRADREPGAQHRGSDAAVDRIRRVPRVRDP